MWSVVHYSVDRVHGVPAPCPVSAHHVTHGLALLLNFVFVAVAIDESRHERVDRQLRLILGRSFLEALLHSEQPILGGEYRTVI